MKKRLTVVLVMLILAMFFVISVNLQSQEKDLVVESMATSNAPIKIDSFNVKDVRIKSGEKFSGSNEWLKDLKINIENASGKTATHISFGILFSRPDGQKDTPPAHYRILRGDKTKALKLADSKFKVMSELNKNQASVSLSHEELEGLLAFLSSLNYPTKIKKIKVHVEEVVFDDGTMWSVGTWYKIDPNDPENPIRIEEKGSARNSTAFSTLGEDCVSPTIINEDCIRTGNFVCSVKRAYVIVQLGRTHELIEGIERCYVENANGQHTNQACGLNRIVNIAIPCPNPSPTPSGCNQCEEISGGVTEDSAVCLTNNLEDTDCCNNTEAAACTLNGGVWDNSTCTCISPIVIDVAGDGFDLTDAANGVSFDILNTGSPKQVAWTSIGSDDAWLALDRNENGRIDKGRELFGSSTPQPFLADGESKNGFRALAVFDKPQNGGNGDGQIDDRDEIFADLKLWRDANHNGVSEASELRGVAESGITIIELDYQESRRQDAHGNWFRYRAKVKDAQGAQVGRWAWDVFLQVAP